jgi:Flp pilus assembly protein TadD
MGTLLMSHGKSEEAIGYYRKALELSPAWPEVANNLAWILATHPNSQIRDGPEAVRLARIACAATRYRDPTYLGTLAAAYAQNGDFTQAVDYARKTLGRAETLRDQQNIDAAKTALILYEQNKPSRIPPQSNPS